MGQICGICIISGLCSRCAVLLTNMTVTSHSPGRDVNAPASSTQHHQHEDPDPEPHDKLLLQPHGGHSLPLQPWHSLTQSLAGQDSPRPSAACRVVVPTPAPSPILLSLRSSQPVLLRVLRQDLGGLSRDMQVLQPLVKARTH